MRRKIVIINKHFQARSVDWFDSLFYSNTSHGEFNTDRLTHGKLAVFDTNRSQC